MQLDDDITMLAFGRALLRGGESILPVGAVAEFPAVSYAVADLVRASTPTERQGTGGST